MRTTSATINGHTLELVLGDIARQQVDAIVNAANSRLAGGGGVDGAIHRAGGPAIMADTRKHHPDGCPTGSAVIGTAGNLHAKYVIHAVGPVWSGGGHRPKGGRGEEAVLASAYRKSLELATAHQCHSIALPALSAGAYGYPIDEASRVAIQTVAAYFGTLAADQPPQLARFVLFSPDTFTAFEHALRTVIADK
jgi:O-acetyl-ADP-ribose deacetylase (regulator of RNase III)